jgi:hypothetical protein
MGLISQTFLPRLAWNHDPPGFMLLNSLRWQTHITLHSYCLRWSLANSLSWLAWNHDPPDSSLPSN